MAKEPAAPPKKLDEIMQIRREKGQALREAGSDPYRNDIKPTISLAALRAKYEPTKPPPAPPAPKPAPGEKRPPTPPPQAIDGEVLRVGGRAMARREAGKSLAFVDVRDTTDKVQLYIHLDHLDPNDFATVLPNLDIGDQVVAEGPAVWAGRGELSIMAKRLWVVTKALRPLPDKWEGLSDIEDRYRQRYVDLTMNLDVRQVFRKRSQIVSGIRRFLDARNYLEVETPMMHTIIGGAAARPFITHHNALDMKLYMRIAPELYLKRLVVGGFERVYEINRNFRNEGLSRRHNPEFTMLEFYQAYATYHDLMDLTEEMISSLSQQINGGTKVTWDGQEVELAAPWRRITVQEAVKTLGGLADADQIFDDPVHAAEVCAKHDIPRADIARVLLEGVPMAQRTHTPDEVVAAFKANPGVAQELVSRYPDAMERRIRAGHLGYLLFEKVAEDKLVQPTFLTQFPLAVSPLARRNDKDPAFCDRFELFVCGKEIANGFSELNDPDDQRSRFQAQVDAKNVGAAETMDYDEDYCRALELGMPPTAGEGIGIDRLAMLLTGQDSIRDVILFPLMRPE